MTYEIWYKKHRDGRAPESVFLADDYTQAGEIEAGSLSEVQRKIQTTSDEEEKLYNHRNLEVGDVVQSNSEFYILTPVGIWSKVVAFLD